jgi:hypothetical protein
LKSIHQSNLQTLGALRPKRKESYLERKKEDMVNLATSAEKVEKMSNLTRIAAIYKRENIIKLDFKKCAIFSLKIGENRRKL